MKIVVVDCDHDTMEPEKAVAREERVELAVHQCATPAEAVRAAAGADAIISQRLPLDAEFFRKLDGCKVLGRYGSGMDGIDAAAARDAGIRIVYTPDFCYPDVADHAMAMILDLARQTTRMSTLMKRDMASFAKAYPQRLSYMRFSDRLSTRRLGIIGFGKVGREVARRARPFGFDVVAFDPIVTAQTMATEGVKQVDLDELLRTSDFVTLHTPLTPQTRGMIGAKQIALMRPNSFFINVARGAIVDEPALIRALDDGRIAGGGFDVSLVEPMPPDHPFLRMDNVVLTPHTAFYSNTSIQSVKSDIVRYTVHALKGKGPFIEFNPDDPLRPIRNEG